MGRGALDTSLMIFIFVSCTFNYFTLSEIYSFSLKSTKKYKSYQKLFQNLIVDELIFCVFKSIKLILY